MKRARSFLEAVEDTLDAIGRYLGRAGTLAKLVQAAPVAIGLLVVFFSPNAWLSGTLRRWALGGIAVGAVLGAASWLGYGRRVAHKQGLAFLLLLALVLAAAATRLHLAVADVLFVERWRLLRPLHDLYLGSDAGELAFDALTSLGFALAVGAATLAVPVAAAWLRERRRKRALAGPDAKAELSDAMRTLSTGVERLQRRIETLEEERDELRERLAEARARAARAERTEPAERDAASGDPPGAPRLPR